MGRRCGWGGWVRDGEGRGKSFLCFTRDGSMVAGDEVLKGEASEVDKGVDGMRRVGKAGREGGVGIVR